jgi:hypothetical protein
MGDTGTRPGQTDVELADVVRRFGSPYTAQYGPTMLPSQKRALSDIPACCTRELGGRLFRCADCRESFWRYHCCRNRACPKCHGRQTRQWLDQRQAELLPCDYFHAVATVPSQLHGTFRRHQKALYGLLMQVTAEAVKELCAEKRHLGALPGMLAVLHTWNGRLAYHPHVHLLITGGGISPDGQHWEPARGAFLVPVAVLSRKIAALFRDGLKARAPAVFADIPPSVWQQPWVSFIKHYGHGHDAVLAYLSRYIFRTAITSARLKALDATHVTFRWKDRQTHSWRRERLPGVAFLRRFLQHVLPRGFHKVRYYGLWHASKRSQSARAWLLLTLQTPADSPPPRKLADVLEALRPPAPAMAASWPDPPTQPTACPQCPHCGSARTRLLGQYPRYALP